MGLAIDGNVVHGIARGGQAFLTMQTNKDGSINLGGNLYAKQDPIVGKDIIVDNGATVHYMNGYTLNNESGELNTVVATLKDDQATYYFYNTYEKSSGQVQYAYVKSTDTKMPNS